LKLQSNDIILNICNSNRVQRTRNIYSRSKMGFP